MPEQKNIPFNRPAVTGHEESYLLEVLRRRKFSGGGEFSRRCGSWLRQRFGVPAALVTTSGTHALEMAALLCRLEPGDEVILPSFGFSSTATAFVRCGARLVFVDVRASTMNIDPEAVAAAIGPRTRVIVALHYAGVPCDMDALNQLARSHDLVVVEDAAQAIFSKYGERLCGTLGDYGCFSFHETKNLQCGEGGALLVSSADQVGRAEVIWEKGTDRARFFRGEIDKYTWRDIGSSYVASELTAAFLLAQLERGRELTEARLRIWDAYRQRLDPLVEGGRLEVARVPEGSTHNGHIFWVKVKDLAERTAFLSYLADQGVHAVFHYLPLHSSPAGVRFGRFHGEDRVTTRDSERLVRLPLFDGLEEVECVADAIEGFYRNVE